MNKIVAPGITQAHKPFHHEAMEKEANRGGIYVTALSHSHSFTICLPLPLSLLLTFAYYFSCCGLL